MLGMKNHFDISGSIEIHEVDIAGVACNSNFRMITATFLCVRIFRIFTVLLFSCEISLTFVGNREGGCAGAYVQFGGAFGPFMPISTEDKKCPGGLTCMSYTCLRL